MDNAAQTKAFKANGVRQPGMGIQRASATSPKTAMPVTPTGSEDATRNVKNVRIQQG